MNEILIDRKKYVLLPKKSYEALQKKAAQKTKSEQFLSIEEARKLSKRLIRKWVSEK